MQPNRDQPRSPGLRSVGCVFTGKCPSPSGPICRVRRKVPVLSHSWTGPPCLPGLQTSPLQCPGDRAGPSTSQPCPPRGGTPPLPGSCQQWVWKGLGLGACCGRSGDRQPLVPPTREGSLNTSVPPGTQASLRPGRCPGVGLAQPHCPSGHISLQSQPHFSAPLNSTAFSLQFSSVTQSCTTLCNPMECSRPGFPVHHQLPELTQTHVH